ncbi:MAG: glycosyltransferase family 2 protein [Anaerolineae bacterium]|nr:glycosyltransferase family 2 protein [Gemmatimonadaceae bacterium]
MSDFLEAKVVMQQPVVSVIIPFFNAAGTLSRCLDAIRSQTFPRDGFEVIAIDNNSTDHSVEVVRRYSEVTLLREPSQGAYAARNRGVASAQGSILVFTDPDCVPNADWLEAIARAMQAGTTEVLIGGYVLPQHSGAVRLLVLYENVKDEFVFGTHYPELYYGHTNNMAVRRTTFDRFGPFVERRRGADTIFVRRVVQTLPCSAVRYDPSALVAHLEIADVLTYYRKMATYGESRESYRHLSWTRPLSMRERVTVIRRTLSEHRLSLARSLQLALLLSVGLIAWRFGRALAQFHRLGFDSGQTVQ